MRPSYTFSFEKQVPRNGSGSLRLDYYHSKFYLLLRPHTSIHNPVSSQWHKFESKEGKFEVLIQGIPILSNLNGSPQLETIPGKSFLSVSGGLYYNVTFQDYPESPLQNQSLEEFLLEKQEAATGYMDSNLILENDLLIDGIYPAREFYVESSTGNPHVRMRIFLVDNYFYLVSVASYEKVLFSQNSEKFFNSFKLLK